MRHVINKTGLIKCKSHAKDPFIEQNYFAEANSVIAVTDFRRDKPVPQKQCHLLSDLISDVYY